MRHLLECVGRDDALEVLQLNRVAGGHNVRVCACQCLLPLPASHPPTVDLLDKRLDLALLGLLRLGHAAGDLGWVRLDTGNESVGEGV